jgi:hypothetical protein
VSVSSPARGGGPKYDRRLLLVCYFDPGSPVTVHEYITLWQVFSRYRIEILNLWPADRSIPASINLDDFDGCILHSTVSYNPDQLQHIDRRLQRGFAEYDGAKILVKQDEHRRADDICAFLKRAGFDLLITCLPESEQAKVYPREKAGEIRFLQALTGYISPSLADFAIIPDTGRDIDISYRGSLQPLSTGRLGLEKRKIGGDVTIACRGRGLHVDISSRWEDRIAGPAWFDFLGRSKAVLGVESGSNLFDFTGEVERWCERFTARHRDDDPHSEEFYRRAYNEYLKDFEENVIYAQISPRHFEAAATRTLQIMYEGEYSGIFKPHRHFVPLRRDLANFDDVLDIVRDDRQRRDITEATYEEIVRDPRYRYEHFVAQLDDAIDGIMADKNYRAATITGTRSVNADPGWQRQIRDRLVAVVFGERTRQFARAVLGILPARWSAVLRTKLAPSLWRFY